MANLRIENNNAVANAPKEGLSYLNPALTPLFLSEFALKSAFAPKIYAAVDRFSPE